MRMDNILVRALARFPGSAPRRFGFRSVLPLVLLVGWIADAAATNYVHDANGRLVAVTGNGGPTTVYSYDAVGNILTVQQIPSNQLALFAYGPMSGAPGTQITIQGNGFSMSPGGNTVTINGIAATVLSASATQLIVQIPTGASSGPLSVTVGTSTATASPNVGVGVAPTVSGFSPPVANGGGTVTVSGTNLNPISGLTNVAVGPLAVAPGSLSATQVQFQAPAGGGSGPILVRTPFGQAVTSSDLIVLPPPLTTTNLLAHAALVAGGTAQSLSINQHNKYGLYNIDAVAGQFLSLQLTTLTVSPSGSSISYTVYTPLNQIIYTGNVTRNSAMSIHMPQITVSGTYLVAFFSGGATAQITAALEADPVLNGSGPGAALATTVQGQSKRAVYSASAQNQALAVTHVTVTPTSAGGVDVALFDQVGNQLSDSFCSRTASPGCSQTMQNESQSGFNSVLVSAGSATKFTATVTLSQDFAATLTPGSPLTVNLTAPGEQAALTIAASAGQSFSLYVKPTSMTPANTSVGVTIYAPDGSTLASEFASGAQTFDLPNLAAGTYTAIITTDNSATGVLQVTLAPGLGGVLPTDGTSKAVSSTVPGQGVFFTFSATAGQSLAAAFSNIVLSPDPGGFGGTVQAPDGTQVGSIFCSTGSPNPGCEVSLATLPQTGTYTLTLNQFEPANGSWNMTVNLSTDVAGSLAPGTSQPLSLRLLGQNALLTFSVAATASYTLHLTSVVPTPAGVTVSATVYDASGSQIATTGTTSGDISVDMPDLAAGAYTVLIAPGSPASGSLQVEITAD